MTPILASSQVPLGLRVIAAATPTMAKWEALLANLAYAVPVRGASAGMTISLRISFGRSDVVSRSTNRSPMPMVRCSPVELVTTWASRARVTAGRSAAGSEWAKLPPMVPMFRTRGSATMPAASASAWARALTRSDDSNWAWVVMAPMARPPSCSRM